MNSFDYIYLMSILFSVILSLTILLVSFISTFYLTNIMLAYFGRYDQEIRAYLIKKTINKKIKF